jgi:hypothetical protein
MILASIAVIAAGVAFLFQGVAVAARHRRLVLEAGGGDVEIEAGMSAEIPGGLAGVMLGIFGLIGIATIPLLAIGAIVYAGYSGVYWICSRNTRVGGAALLGGGALTTKTAGLLYR